MRKLFYIFILVLVTGAATAQTRYINNVKFDNLSTQKVNDQVQVNMNMLLEGLNLNANDMLILTPVLRSNNGTDSVELAPVVVLGKVRNKVVERNEQLNNPVPVPVPANAQTVLSRKNRTAQTVKYTGAVPFREWMSDASLKVRGSVKGCADCDEGLGDVLLTDRVVKEPYEPLYKLTYIVPEVEPVKARSASHAARFNYKVGAHELLPDFGNNAAELARVDKAISEIQTDKDLTITNLTITGYASPEGSANSNMSLSQRRANAFADYLVNRYGLARNQFQVNWYGEDWKGLEEAVKASSLADKNAILSVIASVNNPDARDAELKKLSGGQTYQTLLATFYPPLRRNEYKVAYVARAFDVNEAKEIIKTRPQLLSLNEMYLVSETYPANSKEFKEVFDIATRLYPNEPIAIINSAATDIEGGNNQAAIDRLSRIETDARAWNNLGVAYARMGEYEKAKVYFDRAILGGDADAKENLAELEKVM